MKTVVVIQARMGSTRLPGKVMMPLGGGPTVLDWCLDAASAASGINEIVIATSTDPRDDIIASHYKDEVRVVRGSEEDVISRYRQVQKETSADLLCRVTGDCPFIDPHVLSAVIRLLKDRCLDFACNTMPRTYPDGLDVECFTEAVLEHADIEAVRAIDRECVTTWMVRNGPYATVVCSTPGLEKERWVLDTKEDYEFCQAIANRLGTNDLAPSMYDILEILDREPELRKINSMWTVNERYFEVLAKEENIRRDYYMSKAALGWARKTIPLGCQTFSKSHIQFPGNSPLFLEHGKGAYVYDVDGNEFVDCMGGLLPIILGYCDPDVDYAIRNQLNRGISFSLATVLEQELAQKLVELIPCAEMVRFGKNGSDVTSVAVRLARAFTNRDYVLTSGYHGWGDAFVGPDSLRGRGVPGAISELSVLLKHGDSERAIRALKTKRYACVIVEPETNPEFLQVLRDMCHETGTLLIFDEIITGFRWPGMSAQRHFQVIPDLATFGKAMANGMPLSAIVGRKDIMKLMEPPNNIFYSGTNQGETLSLAAALATINKLEKEDVVENINLKRTDLDGKALKLAQRHNIPVELSIAPGLTRVAFGGGEQSGRIGTLFREAMAKNGVLILNAFALSHAFGDMEIKRVEVALEASFRAIKEAMETGNYGEARALAVGAEVR